MSDLPVGIDPDVWQVVATHAEWVKVPTEDAGCVAGVFLRRVDSHDAQ